jgi:hypothetical protein
MLSLMGLSIYAINPRSSDGYKESILEFQEKARLLRFGYIPGVVRHYFHGIKKNRKYHERWEILVKHDYDPKIHIKKNVAGLIVPTEQFSESLKTEILEYFQQRNEDER